MQCTSTYEFTEVNILSVYFTFKIYKKKNTKKYWYYGKCIGIVTIAVLFLFLFSVAVACASIFVDLFVLISSSWIAQQNEIKWREDQQILRGHICTTTTTTYKWKYNKIHAFTYNFIVLFFFSFLFLFDLDEAF